MFSIRTKRHQLFEDVVNILRSVYRNINVTIYAGRLQHSPTILLSMLLYIFHLAAMRLINKKFSFIPRWSRCDRNTPSNGSMKTRHLKLKISLAVGPVLDSQQIKMLNKFAFLLPFYLSLSLFSFYLKFIPNNPRVERLDGEGVKKDKKKKC